MRKQHPSASKAKIVTEAIKEEKTISQIASENGIHPTQISQWKSLALTGLPTLFERHSKAQTDQIAHEAQTEELYAQIGKLTTQVAWLKKIWSPASVERNGWLSWSGKDQTFHSKNRRIYSRFLEAVCTTLLAFSRQKRWRSSTGSR